MFGELFGAVLQALVTWLTAEFHRIFGSNPGGAVDPANNPIAIQRHQWVTDGVNKFFDMIESHSPDWARPEEEAFKPVLADMIEQAVAKLGIT